MSKYWNKLINDIEPYVAGEQPKTGQNVIKLKRLIKGQMTDYNSSVHPHLKGWAAEDGIVLTYCLWKGSLLGVS